ncbi:MAG TPA: hypothetical protein ENJ95_17785 [Bacteroidetes bacterium]|nr:hypothetical protein [Bacteroidota bacterium]
MKKLLKILGYLLLFIVAAIFIFWLINNEKEPVGEASPAADQLAEKMMAAVDKTAWDSTRWVQWSFTGAHHFLWDKSRNLVKVNWEENEVLLNTKSVTGKAWQNGQEVMGDAGHDIVWKAWSHFCNDSYWLNPMVKAFDPGTERSIVKLKDGREGLKVQYKSGGVTPGDSYVWILDENHRPTAWNMWVKIIPLGGIENSWEDWQTLSTGAQVSTTHTFFGKPVQMISDVKTGMELADFGVGEDPFLPIL